MIERIRYLVCGALVADELMVFRRLHAVGEQITLEFQEYRVLAVIVDGTTQIVDMESVASG